MCYVTRMTLSTRTPALVQESDGDWNVYYLDQYAGNIHQNKLAQLIERAYLASLIATCSCASTEAESAS